MEALEADLWQEAKLWQESELQKEAKIKRTEVESTEEGEGSGTGVLEEEEVRYNDNKEGDYEGTTTSGEDINGTGEDAERDDNVSDGDEDVDWDAIWSGGGSEAYKW